MKKTALVVLIGLVVGLGAIGLAVGHGSDSAAIEKIGTTYPIQEKHAIHDIQARLQAKQDSGELAEIQEQIRQRIEQSMTELPPLDLPIADKAHVYYMEPSYTLPQTLYDHEGGIVAPAGTVVKPLEVAPIPFKLFFFDGRDEAQVELARQKAQEVGSTFLPILTAGRWDELSRSFNQAVYYDQQGRMVKSFGVQAVPSMVSQEGNRLKIEEFKP